MKQKLNCILLIDDDEASNFLSNIIIDEVNCAVHIKTEQTAIAALSYIAESAPLHGKQNLLPYPDLIFLDINMPSMNGWEFLGRYRELKNNGRFTPIIIMLSSSVNPEDKLKALNIAEVSEFHVKPMTTEIINSIVEKYFPDHI